MEGPDLLALLPAEIVVRICQLLDCDPQAHECEVRVDCGTYVEETFRSTGCKITTLASLVQTCKHNHQLVVAPLLYRAELRAYWSFGMLRAAKNGRRATLDKFREYGGQDYLNDTTFSRGLNGEADFLLFRLFDEDDGFYGEWEAWWISDEYFDDEIHRSFAPLEIAAMYGHDEVVARLLDYGASIEVPSRKLCACQVYAMSVVEYRNPESWFGEKPWTSLHPMTETALHFAVLHMGDIEGIRALVEAGTALEVVSELGGMTPAGLACVAGNFEAVLSSWDRLEENSKQARFYQEVEKHDLVSIVQRSFDNLFLELPPGMDCMAWSNQQRGLLRRLSRC